MPKGDRTITVTRDVVLVLRIEQVGGRSPNIDTTYRAYITDGSNKVLWNSQPFPSYTVASNVGNAHLDTMAENLRAQFAMTVDVIEVEPYFPGGSALYQGIVHGEGGAIIWTTPVVASYTAAERLAQHHKTIRLDRIRESLKQI